MEAICIYLNSKDIINDEFYIFVREASKYMKLDIFIKTNLYSMLDIDRLKLKNVRLYKGFNKHKNNYIFNIFYYFDNGNISPYNICLKKISLCLQKKLQHNNIYYVNCWTDILDMVNFILLIKKEDIYEKNYID